MNIWPGACVIANGMLLLMIASWAETPHAWKIIISPGLIGTGSPQSGFVMSVMPIAAGSPMWTGPPWAFGNWLVSSVTLDTSSLFTGRMVTTMYASLNIPASRNFMFVRNIAAPSEPNEIEWVSSVVDVAIMSVANSRTTREYSRLPQGSLRSLTNFAFQF